MLLGSSGSGAGISAVTSSATGALGFLRGNWSVSGLLSHQLLRVGGASFDLGRSDGGIETSEKHRVSFKLSIDWTNLPSRALRSETAFPMMLSTVSSLSVGIRLGTEGVDSVGSLRFFKSLYSPPWIPSTYDLGLGGTNAVGRVGDRAAACGPATFELLPR